MKASPFSATLPTSGNCTPYFQSTNKRLTRKRPLKPYIDTVFFRQSKEPEYFSWK